MDEKHLDVFSTVLIYSQLWPVAEALTGLCSNEDVRDRNVVAVMFQEDILMEIMRVQPELVILDISPRVSCALLNKLRHYHPSLSVIITQPRFLFSDRVVAEYFGNIWLKEYDSLLAGYPAVLLPEHLIYDALAGIECGGTSFYRGYTELPVLQESLTDRIRCRLFDISGSSRLCEVVMEWLVKGVTPLETGLSLARSSKVVYHYRWQAMRLLNIHNPAKDFIPSLTVEITLTENASGRYSRRHIFMNGRKNQVITVGEV